MLLKALLCLVATYANISQAKTVSQTNNVGPTIDFANKTGNIEHLASGILYGLPNNQSQIPSHLLSGFGFNYARAAGAQVGHGWCWSPREYKARFSSALSNYQLTRAHNGYFVLMLHDLWGFDSTQNSSSLAPGDSGDWSSYDAFLNAVIHDIKKHKMQSGLIIDIWNEPEGAGFWGRSIEQWLAMYGRGYYRLRAAFKSGSVLLSGPTTAGQPSVNYNWWYRWAEFVSTNKSVPDQYAWHEEVGDSSSMTSSFDGLVKILKKYKLPMKTVNINEYGVFDEQVPAGSAFWIAQLERYNAVGIRGNWLGGTQLHDLCASLLSKPDPENYTSGGYFPNGDYQVYKYYKQSMTGHRVGTTVSVDGFFDAYATVGDGHARILMGVRPPTTGNYNVNIENLSSLGLPTSGTLGVRTLKFTTGADAHYSKVEGPQDLGVVNHDYIGNKLTLGYYQTDTVTSFAWEFGVKL